MGQFLVFMSKPYAQNILASLGIIVTAIYVILTYRLLKSAEDSGKQTARLVESNHALVSVMEGQLSTMRDQHRFALDIHGTKAKRETRDRVDAFDTVDMKLEVLRVLTYQLEELEAQLPSWPQAWKAYAQDGYDTLGMAQEYGYARRVLIAAAKVHMETLERFLERLKPETQVFMLTPDELQQWSAAKTGLLRILREMFKEAPPEASHTDGQVSQVSAYRKP